MIVKSRSTSNNINNPTIIKIIVNLHIVMDKTRKLKRKNKQKLTLKFATFISTAWLK